LNERGKTGVVTKEGPHHDPLLRRQDGPKTLMEEVSGGDQYGQGKNFQRKRIKRAHFLSHIKKKPVAPRRRPRKKTSSREKKSVMKEFVGPTSLAEKFRKKKKRLPLLSKGGSAPGTEELLGEKIVREEEIVDFDFDR